MFRRLYPVSRRFDGLRRAFSTSDFPDYTALNLPALSPTMERGSIARWSKGEGDQIDSGDVLCEIETDKATVDFESVDDGFLAKILRDESAGELDVGVPIAIMVDEEEDVAKFKDFKLEDLGMSDDASQTPAAPAPAPTAAAVPAASAAPAAVPEPTTTAPPAGSSRVFASPLARAMARENNVDISFVAGTGPNGRVISFDVEEAVSSGVGASSTVSTTIQVAGGSPDIFATSKQTVPHYYLSVDVDLDAVLQLRQELSVDVSVNDIILKAAALTMAKVPAVNSSWQESSIHQYDHVSINLAMSTDDTFSFPVIRDVDTKGLGSIAEETQLLVEQAEFGEVLDNSTGTFSVYNLGMYGVKHVAPIIIPPQAAALGLGAIRKSVVPGENDDTVQVKHTLPVTMSLDHRVVDGAVGAEWLQCFRSLVQNPMGLLL